MANLLDNINQACADFTNIKNAITDSGVEVASGTPSSEYADKVREVYESGKNSVVGDNRTNLNYWYQYLNADRKYDVWEWDYEIDDLIFPEDDIGNWIESLDYPTGTNKATNFNRFFSISRYTDAVMGMEDISIPTIKFNGVLDMSNNTQLLISAGGPYNFHTEDVGKIILPVHNVGFHSFSKYAALKHIEVEGSFFGRINFSDCPLTKASFTSVINALSSMASGQTATFKKTAKEAAFTEAEWQTLISTKPNWTISLV